MRYVIVQDTPFPMFKVAIAIFRTKAEAMREQLRLGIRASTYIALVDWA